MRRDRPAGREHHSSGCTDYGREMLIFRFKKGRHDVYFVQVGVGTLGRGEKLGEKSGKKKNMSAVAKLTTGG